MARPRTTVLVVLTAVLVDVSWSEAWGRQGHRIVARIAAKNLSVETRQRLRVILGTSDAGFDAAMASAAVWPDLIDKRKTGTSNWHFVDAPVGSPFSMAGLCVDGGCVVDQIDDLWTRLKTNRAGFALLQPADPPRATTWQVLAFLVHFVGDIHQPLHASANGERGGHCVELTTPLIHPDGSETRDLHGLWDVDTVLEVLKAHGRSESRTAAALYERFTSGTAVTRGSPADWARESHTLATTAIYQKLGIPARTAPQGQCARNIGTVSIPRNYLAGTVTEAERQLLRAGIRLSNLLNEACRGSGCRAMQ
jgi:hypothetical protein